MVSLSVLQCSKNSCVFQTMNKVTFQSLVCNSIFFAFVRANSFFVPTIFSYPVISPYFFICLVTKLSSISSFPLLSLLQFLLEEIRINCVPVFFHIVSLPFDNHQDSQMFRNFFRTACQSLNNFNIKDLHYILISYYAASINSSRIILDVWVSVHLVNKVKIRATKSFQKLICNFF